MAIEGNGAFPGEQNSEGLVVSYFDLTSDELERNELALDAGWLDRLDQELDATDLLYDGWSPKYVEQFNAWIQGGGSAPLPSAQPEGDVKHSRTYETVVWYP